MSLIGVESCELRKRVRLVPPDEDQSAPEPEDPDRWPKQVPHGTYLRSEQTVTVAIDFLN